MDGFTSMVAPVMMTAMNRNDQDEKKKIAKTSTKPKKESKEESFEEQFGAVYVHSENQQPITYAPPKKRTFTY
ncbi:MAG: hypothetical protein K6F30_06550 [Lachnospiraceae bacterium]|nr:hypothetical protein [Lachnospiraceae bacterium]